MSTFLAIVGALFLFYLSIRFFPAIIRIVAGIGVILIVIFAISGLVVAFLPILLVVGLILLIVKLVS